MTQKLNSRGTSGHKNRAVISPHVSKPRTVLASAPIYMIKGEEFRLRLPTAGTVSSIPQNHLSPQRICSAAVALSNSFSVPDTRGHARCTISFPILPVMVRFIWRSTLSNFGLLFGSQVSSPTPRAVSASTTFRAKHLVGTAMCGDRTLQADAIAHTLSITQNSIDVTGFIAPG